MRRPGPLWAVSALLAIAILPSACGVTHSSAARPHGTTTTIASTTAAPTPTTSAPSTTRPITKVLVFMVENHSLPEMRAGMPHLYAFARAHAYATDYTAITHPSLPNYLAIAGGSTFGVTDDNPPADHPLRGPTVFSQARAHGGTARVYADAMPANCALSDQGTYAVRHNAWTYFVDDRTACRRDDVPARNLAPDVRRGRLPTVGFVIPSVMHDAHDGTLAEADDWIWAQIKTVTSGPDWRSGRLAIIVTADEDDYTQANRVLTIVAVRGQHTGPVTKPLNHYSLSGFLSQVAGARKLRKAAHAPSLAAAFGLAP